MHVYNVIPTRMPANIIARTTSNTMGESHKHNIKSKNEKPDTKEYITLRKQVKLNCGVYVMYT